MDDWTAVFMRHGVQRTQEFDSLGGALSYLFWGEDEGSLSSDGVRGPDGQWAVRAGSDEWNRREREWEASWARSD